MDLSAAGGDSAVLNTPRPGNETFERRPSVADSFTSETPSTTATPKPPRWWAGQQAKNIEETPAVPSSHEALQPRSARDARFEDAPTPQKNQTLTREISPADMRMFLVAHDYNPKDIAFNSEGSLIGATLPVLLEKLTPHDGVADSTLWESFFLTFRLFSEPSQLLEAIEARFDIAPPVRMPLQPDTVRIWNEHKVIPIRRQLLLIVKSWLNTYWNAETDTVVLGPLVVFIEEKLCKAFPGDHTRLLDLINKHKRNSLPASSPAVRVRQLRSGSSASLSGTPYHRPTFSMTSSTAALPPTPIMNKQLFSSLKQGMTTVHVTDFDALELARQFTLLESKLFCAIEPGELIRLGKHKADSLKTMSTLATRITGWVSDRILDEVDARRRTGLLKYFIKVSSVSHKSYRKNTDVC
jgi:son of sevenless-like protein